VGAVTVDADRRTIVTDREAELEERRVERDDRAHTSS
jgi:hypothetical protein